MTLQEKGNDRLQCSNGNGLKFESPLEGWDLDEEFIKEALRQSTPALAVAIDFFDTAVTRLMETPIDVFALVERDLVERHGFRASGYAEARVLAEDEARRRVFSQRGLEEVTLDEIFAQLPNRYMESIGVDTLQELELNFESEVLRAVPDILELTKRLLSRGQKYFFVSDTYLPKLFLERVLGNLGYEGWSSIYVSSELRRTKASGRIWKSVYNDFPLKSFLMIGDNLHSDVDMTRALGIKSLHYSRAESVIRRPASFDYHSVPRSIAKRTVTLISRKTAQHELSEAEEWSNLGKSYGAVILGSFVRWLQSRITSEDLEMVFFLERDGILIHRAWEIISAACSVEVPNKTLAVSRQVTGLVAGFLESSRTELSTRLLDHLIWSHGDLSTVQSLLKNPALADTKQIAQFFFERGVSTGSKMSDPEIRELSIAALREHSDVIVGAIEPIAISFHEYLRQEGFLSCRKIGVVDLGWHGNIQADLSSILKSIDSESSIYGYYGGLWSAASGNRFRAGPMLSCFYSDFETELSTQIGRNGVALLEELFAGPIGSTVGYRRDFHGQVLPSRQESPLEASQFRRAISNFQEAALTELEAIFAGQSCGGLSPSDLTPDSGRATLETLCSSPTMSEISLFSGIYHAADRSHSVFRPLVDTHVPDSYEKLYEAFHQASEFRVAQALTWWTCAREEQKEMVRSVVGPWMEANHPFGLRELS